MDMQYSIVEFLQEKSVALVPRLWLHNENKLSWWPPSSFKGQKLKNTVKNKVNPDPSTWSSHEIRLLKSLNSYHRGLVLAEEAEYRSELESSSETSDSPLRKRIAISSKKLDFEYIDAENSSEEDSVSSHQGSRTAQSTFSFSAPSTSLINGMIAEDKVEYKLVPTTAPVNQPVFLVASNSQPGVDDNQLLMQDLNVLQNDFLDVPSVSLNSAADRSSTLSTVPEPTSTATRVDVQHLNAELQGLRSVLVEELVGINHGIRDIIHRNVAAASSNSNDNSDYLQSILSILPLKSLDNLLNLVELLKNLEHMKLLKTYLGSVGGSSKADITRQILKRLFSKPLAECFTLKGTETKGSFSNSGLYHVVITETRRHFPNETIKEFEIRKVIQAWFIGATDRNGGRRERKRKRFQRLQENEEKESTKRSRTAD